MAFVEPLYTRNEVNRAGAIFAARDAELTAETWRAVPVLANWRGCHAYPINTFQATLRSRLKTIDRDAIVAQRLKRAPSIIAKLRRFEGMQLARMQDIGGLRAVVRNMQQLNELVAVYERSRSTHSRLGMKDYVAEPKNDGYRSVHLIYRYENPRATQYNGLSIELQFRTKMQHAWATAVETMGTFLGQALKSGQGDLQWRSFFTAASAAMALRENTALVKGYENMSREEVYLLVADMERELHVLRRLRGFAVATENIHTAAGRGAYHLIVLDSRDRSVQITPFAITRLEQANEEYAKIEERARSGEPLEGVLVAAGSVEALRKAYPNYFLDTQAFITQLNSIMVGARIKRSLVQLRAVASNANARKS